MERTLIPVTWAVVPRMREAGLGTLWVLATCVLGYKLPLYDCRGALPRRSDNLGVEPGAG